MSVDQCLRCFYFERSLFVVLISLFLLSCGEKKEPILDVKFLDISLDSLKVIETQYQDLSFSKAIQYPNSSSVFFTNDQTENELRIYQLNLDDLRLNQILNVAVDFDYAAFFVDEKKNEVLLFSSDSIYFYDFSNQLARKMAIPEIKNGFLCYLNSTGFPPFVNNNQLYIEHFYDDEGTYSSPNFYKQSFQATVDLNESDVKLLPMVYPLEYQKKCFGYNFIPDRIFNDRLDQIVTFPYNDTVYVYDKEGVFKSAHFFGTRTKRSKEYVPYTDLDKIEREVFDAFVDEIAVYGGTSYYQNAKLYSRFLMDGMKIGNISTLYSFYTSDWKYLGEYKGNLNLFDSAKYGLVNVIYDSGKIKIDVVKM